jgi:hypothetical protein
MTIQEVVVIATLIWVAFGVVALWLIYLDRGRFEMKDFSYIFFTLLLGPIAFIAVAF